MQKCKEQIILKQPKVLREKHILHLLRYTFYKKKQM